MLGKLSIGFALYLAVVASSFAQTHSHDEDSPGWDRQALEAKFEAASPAIGAPLPDLSAYDSEGREFKLSSLKGNYSVLVLGCLT